MGDAKDRAEGLALRFYEYLEQEVTSTCDHLTEEMADGLRMYYKNMIRHPEWKAYYRHNWVRRITAAAQQILAAPGDLEILDAGCGRGTEAIFFASLREGVAVTGVDCHWPSLRTGPDRKVYYERLFNRELQVSFQNGSAFSIPRNRTFDLVWLMEAISHVYPAEVFLERLPLLLRPGGVIGISDSNRLNPFMLLVMLRLRWKGVHFSETTLHETGQAVQMVEEHLFTPWAIDQKLASLGLQVRSKILGGFFPPFVGAYPTVTVRLQRLEDLCQRTPILSRLGGIYTLIAEKTARS